MAINVTTATVRSILTRTTGYLRSVATHSLQPYRGCSFGNALCGVGCYVRHNGFVTRGAQWGTFLEARLNAAESYRERQAAERAWATRRGEPFAIFMSSSTDPFLPHERRYRISRSVLEAMLDAPPDTLILQTHTHQVTEYLPLYRRLAERCRLRVHISIESDRDRLPGLPPPASPVAGRFAAARTLRDAGIRTVVTVSPLLPVRDPQAFFETIAANADAVVIDHFIGGDGTASGTRTRRTALPAAMHAVAAESVEIDYRDRMVAMARTALPGRVGIGIDGFAGRFLPA